MPSSPTLVPNRTCGECTACCFHLPVDTPEFQKMPGLLCTHCEPKKGCKIHQTRPPICREYFCGWRLSDLFDDSWRPDRIGVLMTMVERNIPPDYMQEGIELLVFRPETALAHGDFHQMVLRAVTNRVPLFLNRPGPAGHYSAGVFLNTILEAPVQMQDERAFSGILAALVTRLAEGPFNRVVLQHAKLRDKK